MVGQEGACWEPAENPGGQGQPWETVQLGHCRVAREGPRASLGSSAQGPGALGQLSFHPRPLPLTKTITSWGLD